ncbi:FAD/NAD(P)-binding protein [Streptacidiphilus sp. P02-A3a]|uniref:FAD/NAD(P)-binding protein n=1 Tax=Streptacidiphilus sp. P02-A3a TaxID=2704468 RepID=UPI0015FB2932|nr:FAD/NAD(P)-binding protein [Streptacidiphilus sp. P02-A3a]QMU69678.1 hypothetical protein GXP74_16965 [Streptacidiphilus sp. P02-A3a]
MTAVRDIAVVGAGAAGTLTAMRLLRRAAGEGDRGCRVWLIGPGRTGRGLAFATDAPHHLLNVPAAGMSAHRDDPGHFVRWLGSRAGADDFVPRGLYGKYLADSLADTLDAVGGPGGGPRLLRVRDRVVGLGHRPDRARAPLSLRLRSGQSLAVDAAVLALGNFPADRSWAPPSLLRSPLFRADPWAPGALRALPEDQDLLLVGTGLTMVDAALTLQRPGRVVHAVSRHGLLPRPHAARPLLPAPAPGLDARSGLDPLRRAVLGHLAAGRRSHGDWRVGFDSLRPVTSALWQQLAPAEQARFLREDLRLWEVHRHRIPPVSAEALADAVDRGRVTVGSGTVTDAEPVADALRVRLADGRSLRVGAVVNCTGAQTDLTRIEDPLVTGLLGTGLGSPAPVGGGFDTTPDGRLRPASQHDPAPLWTLGSLRRGNLLETTAVPEIRCQADDLALTLRQHR